MTPDEHLAEADNILIGAASHYNRGDTSEAAWRANLAIAHALVAIGAQMGVPHQHLAAGGGEAGVVPAP